MGLKGFKFQPVRWMTVALALVTALIGANELVHDLTGTDIVPAGLTPYLLGIEALLALLLGAKVRGMVTPLARPRLDEDTPLVPKPFARGAGSDGEAPPSARGGGIGGAGMHSW
jgi:hypothetical protein